MSLNLEDFRFKVSIFYSRYFLLKLHEYVVIQKTKFKKYKNFKQCILKITEYVNEIFQTEKMFSLNKIKCITATHFKFIFYNKVKVSYYILL